MMIDLKKMGLTKLLACAGLVKVGIDRLTKGKRQINAKAEKYAESLKNRIEPKKARPRHRPAYAPRPRVVKSRPRRGKSHKKF